MLRLSSKRPIIIGSIAVAAVLAIIWIVAPSGVPGDVPAPRETKAAAGTRTHTEAAQPQRTPASTAQSFHSDDAVPRQQQTEPAASVRNSTTANLDEALARVQTFTSPKERRAYIQKLFKDLATWDAAAIEAAKRLDNKDRQVALLTLLDEWSTSNLSPVERSHLIMQKGLAGAIASELLDGGQTDRALLFTDGLLTGPERANELAEIASVLAETDPTRATQLADSTFTPEQRVALFSQVAAGWTKKDPEAAWEWAGQFSAQDGGTAIQAAAIQAWATQDPAQAAAMAAALPQGQPRNTALTSIAEEWAGKDTAAALQWAKGFSNPDERTAIDRGIASVAPTGVGVMVTAMDGGTLTIGDIVPGGPAANSRQIQKGDQIVGVGQGNGPLTMLQGVPLDQAIKLIRGQAGTPVQLLLNPANGGPQFEVTLPRQQIIHKR